MKWKSKKWVKPRSELKRRRWRKREKWILRDSVWSLNDKLEGRPNRVRQSSESESLPLPPIFVPFSYLISFLFLEKLLLLFLILIVLSTKYSPSIFKYNTYLRRKTYSKLCKHFQIFLNISQNYFHWYSLVLNNKSTEKVDMGWFDN